MPAAPIRDTVHDMATPMTHPTRLRVSDAQRKMLDELEVFWNEDTSSVIRRAIETEHALLIASKQSQNAAEILACAHYEAVEEQYHRRLAELRALREQLEPPGSPLVAAAR